MKNIALPVAYESADEKNTWKTHDLVWRSRHKAGKSASEVHLALPQREVNPIWNICLIGITTKSFLCVKDYSARPPGTMVQVEHVTTFPGADRSSWLIVIETDTDRIR